MKTHHALLLSSALLMTPPARAAVELSELEGHWNAGYLSVPNTLGLLEDAEGVVTSMQYGHHFANGLGYYDINAAGAYTGILDSAVSGTLSLSAAGAGTFAPGQTYRFNDNADFGVCVLSNEPGWFDIQCMSRAPVGTPAVSVLEGSWNLVSLDCPYEILATSFEGHVTGINPTNNFGIFTGNLAFNAAGDYTGTYDGPISGSVSIDNSGIVSFPQFSSGESYRLNASHDVMFTYHNEGANGFRYFTGMVKAPASMATHELAGTWSILAIDTPDNLIVHKNANNQVYHIDGETHFNVFDGSLTFDTYGAFSGSFDGAISGVATAGTNGLVSIPLGASVSFYINASKDVMMAVRPEAGSPGFYELLIMVRSQVPRTISIQPETNALKFSWPDDGEMKLQRSPDMGTWQDVVAPNASYTESLSNGHGFFRLAPKN